jgi:hypothetical protein
VSTSVDPTSTSQLDSQLCMPTRRLNIHGEPLHSLAMPDKNLRLLALDGGGVHGLSALIILEQLMETIDLETSPKPCNHFDIIRGTSTGRWVVAIFTDYRRIC